MNTITGTQPIGARTDAADVPAFCSPHCEVAQSDHKSGNRTAINFRKHCGIGQLASKPPPLLRAA